MTHPHQITDANDALDFILGGNATFTLVSKLTGTRFTFKVRAKELDDGKVMRFASVLNGPDNWTNYEYIGYVSVENDLVAGGKGKPQAPSFKALQWALRHLRAGNMPEALEFWGSGRCCRCGRKLTVPSSIKVGMGDDCAKKGAL